MGQCHYSKEGAMSSPGSPSATRSVSICGAAVWFMSLAIPARQAWEGAEALGVVEGVANLAGEQFNRVADTAEGGGVG